MNSQLVMSNYVTKIMFKQYFNLDLIHFMHPIYGFDIVRFDTAVQCPDNISLSDHLTQTYGKQASEVINQLIKL